MMGGYDRPEIQTDGELCAPEEMGLVDMGQMGTSAEPVSHEWLFKCVCCKKLWPEAKLKFGDILKCPDCQGNIFTGHKQEVRLC